MHKSFSDWHRHAALKVSDLPLTELWAGVEDVVKKLDTSTAVEVARLAMGVECSGDGFVSDFRAVFRAHDQVFPDSDNELHERVLAGSCVIELQEHGEAEFAEFASLAVSCLAFGRTEGDESGPPVRRCAESYLARRSTEIREQSTTAGTRTTLSLPKKKLEELARVAAEQESAWLAEPLQAVLEEILCAASVRINAETKARQDLETRVAVQAEETNIIWWLFGGWSRDLTRPWSQIKLSAASILAGKELSDLTEFRLGPVGSDAFLDKVLSGAKGARGAAAKTITLKAAVNELPRDWREAFVKQYDTATLPRVLPVASAIHESTRVGPNDDWCSAAAHCSSVDAELTCPPLEFAAQVYRECLLSDAMARVDESD